MTINSKTSVQNLTAQHLKIISSKILSLWCNSRNIKNVTVLLETIYNLKCCRTIQISRHCIKAVNEPICLQNKGNLNTQLTIVSGNIILLLSEFRNGVYNFFGSFEIFSKQHNMKAYLNKFNSINFHKLCEYV